jgi:hypothetical protein
MRHRHKKSNSRVDTQESETETTTTNDGQVTSRMQYANPTSTLLKVYYSSSRTQMPQVSPQLTGNKIENTFGTLSRIIISLANPWPDIIISTQSKLNRSTVPIRPASKWRYSVMVLFILLPRSNLGAQRH